MRSVRAAAGAGVAAAALALVFGAGPARAGAPDIAMTSPTGGGVVGTSTPTITGTASATSPDGTVTGNLQVAVTSTAGHPGWRATAPACGQSSCSFSLPVSPPLLWNGGYTLSVQATETDPGGQGQPVTYEASFAVAAPPAAPSGLTATPSADGRSVGLSWSEPSYPDLVGFQVTRSPSGPGFPARVSGTGFSDRSTSAGSAYSYQVTALRPGATSGTTVSSAPGGTSVGGPPPGAPSGSSGSSGSASGSPPAGSSAAGSSAAGSTAGAPGSAAGSGVGTYSSAGGLAPGGAGASGLGSLLTPSGSAAAGLPALPAPSLPSLPSDSAEPGPDNPAVAPFSSGSSEAAGGSRRGVTITYGALRGPGHSAVVRDVAAVGLAALLLAVVAHLLWLRRLVQGPPSPDHLA